MRRDGVRQLVRSWIMQLRESFPEIFLRERKKYTHTHTLRRRLLAENKKKKTSRVNTLHNARARGRKKEEQRYY